MPRLYCGCCGREASPHLLWCDDCHVHAGISGPLWERTFEARTGRPCPHQVAFCGEPTAFVEPRDDRVAALEHALRLTISGLPDSDDGGPDGRGYRFAWDQCTEAEQFWVSTLRARSEAVLNADSGVDGDAPERDDDGDATEGLS